MAEGYVIVKVNEKTGDREDCTLPDYGYMLFLGDKMAVTSRQRYFNGTEVITIKPAKEAKNATNGFVGGPDKELA